MPAVSIKERRAMAIAEHEPDKLYSRNKSLLNMSHQQLHDFASTSESNLPMSVRKATSRIQEGRRGKRKKA